MINPQYLRRQQKLALILIAIDALDPYIAQCIMQRTMLDYIGLAHCHYVSKCHPNSWLYRANNLKIIKTILELLSYRQIQDSIQMVLQEFLDQKQLTSVSRKKNYLRRFFINIHYLRIPYITSLDNCLELGSNQLAVYLLILMRNCSTNKGIHYLLNYVLSD